MPMTKWNTLLAVCDLSLGVLVLGACGGIRPAENTEDPMADQVSQSPSEHSEEERWHLVNFIRSLQDHS